MDPWSTSSFYFGNVIGEGRFGKVYHGKYKKEPQSQHRRQLFLRDSSLIADRSTNINTDDVAIKAMDKLQIVKDRKTQMVLRERNILTKLGDACTCADLCAEAGKGTGTGTNKSGNTRPCRTVRLFMSFVDDQNLYLVTELCEIGTLSAFRESISTFKVTSTNSKSDKSIPFPIDIIQIFAGQILAAVEFMHSHCVVHCDLKPDNIMIDRHFQIKIVDFGCAIDVSTFIPDVPSNLGSNKKNTITNPDIDFAGTADYVSPEVIKGASNGDVKKGNTQSAHRDKSVASRIFEDLDAATPTRMKNGKKNSLPVFQLEYAHAIDLWAYGCLLYFMLEGEAPFHGQSEELTIRRIIEYVRMYEEQDDDELVRLQCFQRKRKGDADVDADAEDNKYENTEGKGMRNSCLDLVNGLLVPNPGDRLGASEQLSSKDNNVYNPIRSHEFYNGFNWGQIDQNEELNEQHRHTLTMLLSSKRLNVDIRREDMYDGASLPFDFFT